MLATAASCPSVQQVAATLFEMKAQRQLQWRRLVSVAAPAPLLPEAGVPPVPAPDEGLILVCWSLATQRRPRFWAAQLALADKRDSRLGRKSEQGSLFSSLSQRWPWRKLLAKWQKRLLEASQLPGVLELE